MIIKKRSTDYKILGLQMLYQRLPNEHAMKSVINSKLLSAKAGIIGEQIVEEVFTKYNFPFDYCVLHDVNLSSNGKFQIDTLFICQYYAVILECKNIVGSLSFENDPSCLKRELENGQKDTFESPEIQVERNAFLLSEWLNKHGVNIPIIGVIVFSSTKSIVVKPPGHTSVIYANSIPVYLRRLQKQKEYLSVTQMKAISDKIVQHHQPYNPFPMCKNWGINPTELMTGVQCGKCGRFGMTRIKRTWLCPACNHKDSDAHIQTVNEWFVLIDMKMSNSECRNFLQINKSQTTTRILQGMGLIATGEGKGTKYEISEKILSGLKSLYVDRKDFIRS